MTEPKDRRTLDRYEVLLPIDYYTDRDKVHKFHIVSNISAGGAYIHTSRPYKVGDDADFIISFFENLDPDAAPRRYVIHGQVRHVQFSPSREVDAAAGMGVQWLDLDGAAWDDMKRTIERQMGVDPVFRGARPGSD